MKQASNTRNVGNHDSRGGNQSLRSISSGFVVGEKVNADKGREVGEIIIESMGGKNIQEY
ncbi:hypothetical protein DPMN_005029 [Dreissena polymorpha]|uniref:Uncharacterized protein n=1 Tax=Dreissena polymorpha TaxID=45954 RepID=A0A9D4MNW9_DREPO|nr:hypothetical protein DPMN_005029 [Dreissena polymorpha]